MSFGWEEEEGEEEEKKKREKIAARRQEPSGAFIAAHLARQRACGNFFSPEYIGRADFFPCSHATNNMEIINLLEAPPSRCLECLLFFTTRFYRPLYERTRNHRESRIL